MDSNTAIDLMLVVGIIVGGPAITVFGIIYIAEIVEACESWYQTYQTWKSKR